MEWLEKIDLKKKENGLCFVVICSALKYLISVAFIFDKFSFASLLTSCWKIPQIMVVSDDLKK